MKLRADVVLHPIVKPIQDLAHELSLIHILVGQNELLDDFGKGAFSFVIAENMPPKDVAALKAQIEQDGEPENYLCHGDLNQHHILLVEENEMAVIEFNRMHRGVQVEDLYHFTRKILEKHGWDLRLGMRLLETYDRILPLNAQERTYLYSLFLYPEKTA